MPSPDLDELRIVVGSLEKELEKQRDERERVTEQLSEIDAKLTDPDETATFGQLLKPKDGFVKGLDRLNVQIPAIEARLEILTDRLQTLERETELASLNQTRTAESDRIAPLIAEWAAWHAAGEALMQRTWQLAQAGNVAADAIDALVGQTEGGEQHNRRIVSFSLFDNVFRPVRVPVLTEYPPQYHWLSRGADFVFQWRELTPPWRQQTDPAAEPEQTEGELAEEAIAS